MSGNLALFHMVNGRAAVQQYRPPKASRLNVHYPGERTVHAQLGSSVAFCILAGGFRLYSAVYRRRKDARGGERHS